MRKASIILFSAAIAMCVASCGQSSEIPRDYVGLWDCGNGKVLGLYEEFAIFNNDFWEYESVGKKDGGLEISLSNEYKVATISVAASGDSAISISGSNVPGAECKRAVPTFYKSLQDPDSTDFKPLNSEMDSATVIFYCRFSGKGVVNYCDRVLRHFYSSGVGKKTFEIEFCGTSKDVRSAPVDSADHYGFRYKLKVPVIGVAEINAAVFCPTQLYPNESNSCCLILEPGDTLVVVNDDVDGIFLSGTKCSDWESLAALARCLRGPTFRNLSSNANLSESDQAYYYAISKLPHIQGEYLAEEAEGNIDTLLSRMENDSVFFSNSLKNQNALISKRFSDYAFSKIRYRDLNYILENADTAQVLEYFNRNVKFSDNDLFRSPACFALAVKWVKFSTGIKLGHEISDFDLSNCNYAYAKELGFSELFCRQCERNYHEMLPQPQSFP